MNSTDPTHITLPGKLSSKTTLAPLFWDLMEFEPNEFTGDHCMICGRTSPLNNHHMVKRSAGNLILEDGSIVPKPEITLCGIGYNLRDADGNYYCHGKAHNGLLFFRNNDGVLEFLDLTSPEFETNPWETHHVITYQEALEMNGWRPVYGY